MNKLSLAVLAAVLVAAAPFSRAHGKKVMQRMVWRDVKADSLKWLWQRSDDGGKTWNTTWDIAYRRLK